MSGAIALVGPMGAGKNAAGRALAGRLSRPFLDTDELVERAAGRPIPEIWRAEGEAGFRAREAAALREAAAVPRAVIACGGGVVLDPAGVEALRVAGTVVHLEVPPGVAAARVGDGTGRPLLQGRDAPAALAAIIGEREPLYRAAAHRVVDAGRPLDEVVASILKAVFGVRSIRVALGPRSYEVHVGAGSLARAGELAPAVSHASRVVLVSDGNVDPRWGERAAESFRDRGEVLRLVVEPGETSKSLESAGRLLEEMAALQVRRDDLLLALGGGVVGDLGGFVASVYQRGMPLVQLPTSLLAQVDAAVGGKTAVNLAAGKNLAGTFHQPLAVVADTEALATLPEREYRSGLAEVAKYGLCFDPGLLDVLEGGAEAVGARDAGLLEEVVARSVAIKAGVVAADEHDREGRVILNYGHTLAHALEAAGAYDRWLHGEAVAVGMVFAAALACELGILDDAALERHVVVLRRLGLPVAAAFDPEAVARVWSIDKKYRGGQRWVLLKAIGEPVVETRVDAAAIRRAIERVRTP